MKYVFSHQLALNAKKQRAAIISLIIVLGLAIAGYAVSTIFYDQYTYPCYSIRYRVHTTCGWPASLKGWSFWFGLGILGILPIVFFMQDRKNPSIAIAPGGLFLNQQMVRNTLIPFSNIKTIERTGNSYRITYHDPMQIVKKQFFLFRAMVKWNLANNNFSISGMYSLGNLDEFMKALSEKSGVPVS